MIGGEERANRFEPPSPAPDGAEYVDAEGVHWRVTERDARGDPGARGDHCLIFASSDAVRRVWDYPAAWRGLSSLALDALSWRR